MYIIYMLRTWDSSKTGMFQKCAQATIEFLLWLFANCSTCMGCSAESCCMDEFVRSFAAIPYEFVDALHARSLFHSAGWTFALSCSKETLQSTLFSLSKWHNEVAQFALQFAGGSLCYSRFSMLKVRCFCLFLFCFDLVPLVNIPQMTLFLWPEGACPIP